MCVRIGGGGWYACVCVCVCALKKKSLLRSYNSQALSSKKHFFLMFFLTSKKISATELPFPSTLTPSFIPPLFYSEISLFRYRAHTRPAHLILSKTAMDHFQNLAAFLVQILKCQCPNIVTKFTIYLLSSLYVILSRNAFRKMFGDAIRRVPCVQQGLALHKPHVYVCICVYVHMCVCIHVCMYICIE